MNDMAETFMNGARYRRYMSGRFSSFCEANDLSAVDVKVLLFLEEHSGEENCGFGYSPRRGCCDYK